jgi:hypothetical protein
MVVVRDAFQNRWGGSDEPARCAEGGKHGR